MNTKRWTCEEDAKLMASYRKGRSTGDIADRHGRSVGAIQSRLQKHLFHIEQDKKCKDPLTDDDIRAMWVNAGGTFHGPITGTVSMTEARIIKFIRGLL